MKNHNKYTIGQLSKVYQIGTDSLRYYEKIGLLHPERADNNYRLYTTRDIYTLNIIRELRALGFSFDDIKAHLQDYDLASTLALFSEEITIVQQKIDALTELQRVLEARIAHIRRNKELQLARQPRIEYLKERRIFSLANDSYRDEELDFIIKNIQNSVDEMYLIGRGEIGATLPLQQIAQGHYGLFNSVFFVTRQNDYNQIISAAHYVTMGVYGSYDLLPRAWRELFDFLRAHNLTAGGDAIELYIVDNHTTSNPAEFITQLQVPISDNHNRAAQG